MLASDLGKELPTVPRSWIIGAVAVVALVAGLGAYSCHKHHQVSQASANAAVSAAVVATEKRDAVKADAAVDTLTPKVKAATTRATTAAVKVEQDMTSLRVLEQLPVDASHELEHLRLVVKAQAEVIADLKLQVADEHAAAQLQADLAAAALKARDDWRATSADQQAQIVQLQAVISAQKGLVAAAYIKGGLYGFGAGYAAGRLK